MKRFILAVCILLLASPAFAAYTFTATRQDAANGWVQVDVVVTADSTHAANATYRLPYSLGGKFLYSVEIYYGSTGPTDNSDLAILQHSTSGKDVLNGVGANIIDNAANSFIQPRIGTDASSAAVYGAIPVYGTLYVVINNNSVNSATFTVRLNFVN